MDIQTGAQTCYQIGYHIVWGVKYHKHLLNEEMKKFLVNLIKDVCESYDYHFYCLGIASNHIHFFAGAAPKIAPAKIAQVVKSITARELFKNFPQLKKQLWGGEMWKNGYYVGTIGEGQTEAIILKYINKQTDESKKGRNNPKQYIKQLKLFY